MKRIWILILRPIKDKLKRNNFEWSDLIPDPVPRWNMTLECSIPDICKIKSKKSQWFNKSQIQCSHMEVPMVSVLHQKCPCKCTWKSWTYSRTPLFWTWLNRSPCYFERRSNSLGFALMSSVIYYQLFWTQLFRIPRYFSNSSFFPYTLNQPRYFKLVKNRVRT